MSDTSIDNSVEEQSSRIHRIRCKCSGLETRSVVLNILYISVFSIAGTILRIAVSTTLSQCDDESPYFRTMFRAGVCLTIKDSAMFRELPVNMIGSFLMGVFQSGYSILAEESYMPAINAPIAFLPRDHWLQKYEHLHTGIRTGFCGSLTSFSSWNTQLVSILVNDFRGKCAQVLFGYIIGIELACVSFVMGKSLAIVLHRHLNPLYAKEADIVRQKPINFYHHKDLPDFERRYLTSTLDEEDLKQILEEQPKMLNNLERWRQSTIEARDPFCPTREILQDIEESILISNGEKEINLDHFMLAQEEGWDIQALKAHSTLKEKEEKEGMAQIDDLHSIEESVQMRIMLGVLVILITLLMSVKPRIITNQDEEARDLYIFCLSGALSPIGANMRWALSRLNGKLRRNLSWFPLGTFVANIASSIISIQIVRLLAKNTSSAPTEFTLQAISLGVLGSFSTVSTFTSEIDSLMKKFPTNSRGYSYIIWTFLSAIVLCSIMLKI